MFHHYRLWRVVRALGFLLAVSATCAIAQNSLRVLDAHELRKQFPQASKAAISTERNTLAYMRVLPSAGITESEAVSWLRSEILSMPSEEGLELYHQFTDRLGMVHKRYRQTYKGVPVEYGVYYVHIQDGYVHSVNGEYYRGIQVPTTPVISPEQAYQVARQYINAQSWYPEREDVDNMRLMILPHQGAFYLTYRCDIYAQQPLRRDWVYVNALTGEAIKSESRLCHTDVPGTAKTAYYGTVNITVDSIGANSFRLREYTTRTPGIETWNVNDGNDFTSTSKHFDYGASLDAYALDCHFGAEKTYDFYLSQGWHGLNGMGGVKYKSKVHAGPGINAYWDGTYASFLDGDASLGVTPLTSMEVVGHEFTHGVDDYSADLVYSGESGALDESFADITGVAIRFMYTNKGSWYLGDEFNYLIRNMANPNEFECADTYGGNYWNNGDIVHFNSGVGNFWFYLLTEGGSGVNDVGNAYFVEAIGLMDAAAIATRCHLVYLTPNAKFSDFYFYAVQSAQDLFGDCSKQAYQAANAGYAVNIGSVFEDAVTAGFVASQTQFCSLPATVTFTNLSYNGQTYLWDFGDGTTSTDPNPVHTYTAEGTYTVTLMVEGNALCNTADTLIKVNYITVKNIGAPVAATCTPTATLPGNKYGTKQLILGAINNSSGSATAGYEDFSCAAFTELIAGNPYPFTLTVGSNSSDVRMWIDYNSDGAFDNSTELVYSADKVSGKLSGIIYTPVTAPVGVPLRLRIIDDKQQNTITDGCYTMERGQAEDYMVYFKAAPAEPPVVDFTSNVTTINVGQTINFFDLSQNVPTSWHWEFPGAITASSSVQNPTAIQYNDPGTYDVTLTATNAYGASSITKTGYITVKPVINLCAGVTSVDWDNGTIYDSGGPSGNYGNNENCSLLIKPACVKSIKLSFASFSSSGGDELRIYDGTDANAPLLATLSGYPWPYPVVTAYSGAMFLVWTSNNSGVSSGFSASWTSEIGGTITPVVDFTVSDYNPPIGIAVSFTDQSTNIPINWHWDFGDGATSTLKNPVHTYVSSGVFPVTLTASNCGGSASQTKQVIVQAQPVMIVQPTTIHVDLGCGTNVANVSFSVANQGGGDLVYQTAESGYFFEGDKPHVLILATGVDMVDSYMNLTAAMLAAYPNHTLTQTTATTASQLAADLKGKNMFVMPKPTGDPTVFTQYADPLNDFVEKGGTAVLIAPASSKASCLFNTNLLQGTFNGVAQNVPLDVVNTNHPLTFGLPPVIATSPKNTFSYNITTSGFIPLIEHNGADVLGVVNKGLGRVIFIGFDFKNQDDTATLVIGNALQWVKSMLVSDFVNVNPSTGGILDPSQTQVYHVTVNAQGVADGIYTTTVSVTGNDPNYPSETVTITIKVDNVNCNALAADVQCEGTVCFDDTFPFASDVVYHFGDGAVTQQSDPCHIYTQSGTYTVMVVGCGSGGCDTLYVNVDVVLVSGDITYSGQLEVFQPIQFYSNAQNAQSYLWDMGDGTTYTFANPVHTYLTAGTYTVTLTLTDSNGCSVTLYEQLMIIPVGMEASTEATLVVYPNPTSGVLVVDFHSSATQQVHLELWNALAQQVGPTMVLDRPANHRFRTTLNIAEAGVYYLRLHAGEHVLWRKIVVMH